VSTENWKKPDDLASVEITWQSRGEFDLKRTAQGPRVRSEIGPKAVNQGSCHSSAMGKTTSYLKLD